jgi:tRNA-modifying protein YgfZ
MPTTRGYDAARHRAALIDRSDRGRLTVAGSDRAGYLQGLLTNDIAALKPGQGCYAAYLTAQGRMIADLLVYELGDLMLLNMVRLVRDTVYARLDQLIFNEDVTVTDVTDRFGQIAVVGPEAAALLARTLENIPGAALASLPEHGSLRARSHPAAGEPLDVVLTRMTDVGVPGFDIYVEDAGRSDRAAAVQVQRSEAAAMITALEAGGAERLDEDDVETLRIEAGIPRFGRDMTEETIPLEAGIESRAISFTKGCYVGQEVIVRVLHRGHGRIARKLAGLVIDAGTGPESAPVSPAAPPAPPAPGTPVHAAGREVGHVTSAVFSPALQKPIALAYLHRDVLQPGTALSVGGARAVVTSLPFVGH